MNILFLSLVKIDNLEQGGIYPDLLRQFVAHGHYVRVVSPSAHDESADLRRENYSILQVHTAQVQKVGLIKKGFASLLIAPRIKAALKKYCSDERYDLVLMATPPITLVSVVSYVKQRDGAKVYLLLKDIWPQGIADLGIISSHGMIYRFFRSKEKKLYAISDRIGCMSPANVDFVRKHNPWLAPERVELCPNSIEPKEVAVTPARRKALREKYGIPQNKTVFLYGGNLGRPQGVPFIIDCLRACADREAAFFIICGTGTEYPKLRAYMDTEKPANVLLLNGLPKAEYDEFVAVADVGMIFLDYRFTIPNFPSRLLPYLQAGLPVLCCTDPNTDIGQIAEAGGFGWKCLSNDVAGFTHTVDAALRADLSSMGAAGKEYLMAHYTVEQGYEIITRE